MENLRTLAVGRAPEWYNGAMKRWLAVGLLSLFGCGSASGNSAVGAAVMTSLAAASSAASRGAGGCYAQCTHGTVCNRATGLCERLPCGGQCREGQICDPVTDTCTEQRRSVPVEVIGMLARGMWLWPFGPYLTYWNPYYWSPGQDPHTPGPPPARPPTMEPGPTTQDVLRPGG